MNSLPTNKRQLLLSDSKFEFQILQKKCSATGNRTPVSRVTGGDTHHYTIVESLGSRESSMKFFEFKKQRKLNQGGKIPDQYIIALSIAVIIVIIIIIFWSFLLANIKVWRERVIFGEFIVCVPLRLLRNCLS